MTCTPMAGCLDNWLRQAPAARLCGRGSVRNQGGKAGGQRAEVGGLVVLGGRVGLAHHPVQLRRGQQAAVHCHAARRGHAARVSCASITTPVPAWGAAALGAYIERSGDLRPEKSSLVVKRCVSGTSVCSTSAMAGMEREHRRTMASRGAAMHMAVESSRCQRPMQI